jgi:ATP-binding cassette subfamily B (MDR/TAP) protein 1
MSGGQKQRIAIARAMLKNPPILLLDEATSALDAESEQIVQSALDQASVGRTTIIVAHRLSTIRNADLIAVVQGGSVIELGSHDDLLKHEHGAYALLIHLQQTQPSTAQELESGASNSRSLSVKRSSSFRRSVSFHHQASNPRNADGLSPKQSGLQPQSDEIEKAKPPSLRRLLGLNRPEWRQAILGVIGAIGSGVVHPLYAFTLGSMISTFYEPNHAKMRREIEHYSLIFAALAVASFAVNVLRDYFFGDMGTILTKRIRENMLSKVLTFEVGWYDKDENSSGAVSSKLATDANVVRSLVGDRVALLVQTVGAILLACIIGLVVAWPLALVMMALQPIVIIGFYLKKVLLKSMSAATYKAQEEASQVASEAVANHRTITAFSSQDKMLKLFELKQDGPRREASYRALIAGFGLGIAQFCTLGTWAFDFWYGGKLVNDGRITFADMFKTFFILVSTGRLIADAGSMTSDLAKGSNTLTSVFEILDRTTRIMADDADAEKLDKVEGNIEVRDVDFAYPMRPDVMVFKGFSLRVKAGRSIALVGQSGSGKSTIIGLIERYYDPLKGEVRIDGKDIKHLHLQTLRRHIALVGQEPTLFAGTIRENILYGRENATEAEIIEAAKAANAHNFISSLHNGYNTNTGERGLQMSGGQKQRIAIARAILKNPAILLLDEATSALDAQSEKIVQDALDRIMVGRTTVVVAHRLSTVQNAESIAVLQGGAILEQGRHHELLAKGEGGAYYDLVKLQNKAH